MFYFSTDLPNLNISCKSNNTKCHFNITILSVCVCTCVHFHACYSVYMDVRQKLADFFLSFYHVDSGE